METCYSLSGGYKELLPDNSLMLRAKRSMGTFLFQLNYDEESCSVIRYTGNDEHVVIPDSFQGKPVTILFDKLFLGHSEICSIVIPQTVTDMGEFLFDGCVRIHHIDLPESLVHLWGYTFVRCGIEEIVLPDGLRIIPPYAFKDCRNLKKVVCGAEMEKISAWAFGGCDRLTELLHGPDVEISPKAFDRNDSILRV